MKTYWQRQKVTGTFCLKGPSGASHKRCLSPFSAWMVVAVCVIFAATQTICEAQSARGEGLQPWASNIHPTDVAKRRVQEITSGRHEYTITQGGTMDGRNCRSPLGVGMNMEGARGRLHLADKGKAQYTLPYVGLLTPDSRYYWHVRAKDAKGVWGPWSKTWSFTPRGAAYPLEVTLDYDRNKGLGILKWKPNPVGRKPVKYRVYGSDEKGFSVSDEAYEAVVGISKEVPSPFPANFIAQTTATELAVLGAKVNLPAANKAYYRVVAVDEQGKRSGPSDYAAALRPIIYSKPVVAAIVGTEYRYRVSANRSLGDLTNRVVDGKLTKNFWDVEKPGYSLQQGPKWLAIDANSGLLLGTPEAAGKTTVVVTATIDRQVRKLDPSALGWGQEKVIGTTTQRIGSAAQQFVIDVRK